MPNLSHTMLDSDREVQDQGEVVFGFRPCLGQICVVTPFYMAMMLLQLHQRDLESL